MMNKIVSAAARLIFLLVLLSFIIQSTFSGRIAKVCIFILPYTKRVYNFRPQRFVFTFRMASLFYSLFLFVCPMPIAVQKPPLCKGRCPEGAEGLSKTG